MQISVQMFIDAASDEVNLEMKRNDNSYIIFYKAH